ncbi:MAG: L,D-transpeptidase [Longimicrobiales bacterium]
MKVLDERWLGVTGGVLLAAAALCLTALFTPGQSTIRLVLNVPESRLYVYENEQQTRKYRVSVGMEGYETPAGSYSVTHAIWNPWWHPPESDWARDREVEPPGPNNPMGRVKLHFSTLLYIHGTPETAWLGRPASRGCVRMSNHDAVELAMLLHQYSSPGVSPELFDQILSSGQTRRIAMTRPVPFTVVYQVAMIRDGSLYIYPDVYGVMPGELEDQVIAVLRKNGVDLRSVDRAKLQRLIEKGATRKVSMSLDTLTSPSTTPAPGGN